MKPLKVFHVKVHEIAMIMTIALRFVPTLLEETDKIMNAQKARGADMETGSLVQRAKALIPILIPLALRGVQYKPIGASALLRRNLLIYGVGGVIVPFVGIKLIDLLVGLFF